MIRKYENAVKEIFEKKKILVIGDLMVDEYIIGKVSRISPEAPIPILDYGEKKEVAGGASNVANNVSALGGNVTIAGVVGDDAQGEWLRKHLRKLGISTEGLLTETGRPTTVKKRFATKSQQLLRVDIEKKNAISAQTEEKILGLLQKYIKETDAVILSDYQKGLFFHKEFVRKIISCCRANGVIIAIDSKSCELDMFEGATFVKPNNLELEKAVDVKICDEESLNRAGECYLNRSKAEALVVTRGANGISLFLPGKERKDYPSKAAQVYDVTGAGDTVISTVTLGIASGLALGEAIELGNIAAGIVISQVGTVPIRKEELLEKIYEG